MFMRSYKIALLSLLLGASACTLITDANERKVGGAEGDLRFVFKSMAVHESTPMDLAIINQDGLLQGRARMILPPRPASGDFPDVSLVMEKTLGGGQYELLFYIDDNNNNSVDRQPDGDGVLEHIWREPVPKSGQGTFTHNIRFVQFTEQDITDIGGDIVLQAPVIPPGAAEAIKQCFAQKFNSTVRKSLEIKVFLEEDQRQIAYFATFKGNPVPGSVRLVGIVDAPNMYRFDVFIDGAKKSSFNRESEVGKDLVVMASEWLPFTAAELALCLK